MSIVTDLENHVGDELAGIKRGDLFSAYMTYDDGDGACYARIRPVTREDVDVTVRPDETTVDEELKYFHGSFYAQVLVRLKPVIMAEVVKLGGGRAKSTSLGAKIFGHEWCWPSRNLSDFYKLDTESGSVSYKGMRNRKRKAERFRSGQKEFNDAFLESVNDRVEKAIGWYNRWTQEWAEELNRSFLSHCREHALEFGNYDEGLTGLLERCHGTAMYQQYLTLKAQIEGLRKALQKQLSAQVIREIRENHWFPKDIEEAVIETLSRDEPFASLRPKHRGPFPR